MSRRALEDALVAELQRHGITGHRITHGAKHPRLNFEVDGRRQFFVYSTTTFDGCIRQTFVAELRRVLRRAGATPRGDA